MRYLNTYKLFESSDDEVELHNTTCDDIEDMFNDLTDEDDRFVILFGGEWTRYSSIPKYASISKEKYDTNYETTGDFYKSRIPFNPKEVRDFLSRMVDYLGDSFLKVVFTYGKYESDQYDVSKDRIDGYLQMNTGDVLEIKVEFK